MFFRTYSWNVILSYSLYLGIPNVDHLDVWNLFWIVIVNDFIIKFVTVIVKALVALLPKQMLPYKKKVSECQYNLVIPTVLFVLVCVCVSSVSVSLC